MNANIAALLYLASGALFILALHLASSPATSPEGRAQRHDRHGDRRHHHAVAGTGWRPAGWTS